MPREQATLWLGVVILVMLSFLVGQIAAASVAAMVAAYLVYVNTQKRQPQRVTQRIRVSDLA